METKLGVQQVVNELYQKHGEVKSSALVEAAKPKTSPAHKGFEWDNKKAGREYRLMQARQWIKRVEIIYPDRQERLVHVPVIKVERETVTLGEGFYKPISIVAQDKWELECALESVRSRLESAKKSYQELKKAAEKAEKKDIDFQSADKGFDMVETALLTDGKKQASAHK